MAHIPFVDTHFHLHDMRHPKLSYAWLEPDALHPLLGDIGAIKAQHYLVDDFVAEVRFANVPKAIHVQAAVGTEDPVEETKWLQGFADRFGYPHGIVAECHLQRSDAAAVLERHLQYRNVRGIRDFGPTGYLSDPAWQKGWRFLDRLGLVSCLDADFEVFADVVNLAASAPTLSICVDHCGFPKSRSPEYFDAWRRGLQHLAVADNISIKISGLGMFDRRWTVESLRPWVRACIDAFGTKRVVFGTNWPVDRMYSSYPDLLDAYASIIAEFSEAEQRAMFAGNAERLFRV